MLALHPAPKPAIIPMYDSTAYPRSVALPTPAGPVRALQTHGVLTHDESLIQQGRPTKGCCGIYAPTVQTWRAAQAT